MQPLSAAHLLDVWERGRARTPVERAVLLLCAACPESDFEAIAGLPVGRRDGLLLTLRDWTFGSDLTGLLECPACGQRVEVSFRSDAIRAGVGAELADAAEPLTLTADAIEVQFRLPNSRDLMAFPAGDDVDSARRLLIQRCVVSARRGSEPIAASELPPSVVTETASRMAHADPQADVQLDLRCPACGTAWQAAFDMPAYFWNEIDAWAQRTLGEVHVLARAYGWRESDILALSPGRRRLYLDMVSG